MEDNKYLYKVTDNDSNSFKYFTLTEENHRSNGFQYISERINISNPKIEYLGLYTPELCYQLKIKYRGEDNIPKKYKIMIYSMLSFVVLGMGYIFYEILSVNKLAHDFIKKSEEMIQPETPTDDLIEFIKSIGYNVHQRTFDSTTEQILSVNEYVEGWKLLGKYKAKITDPIFTYSYFNKDTNETEYVLFNFLFESSSEKIMESSCEYIGILNENMFENYGFTLNADETPLSVENVTLKLNK